MFARRPKHTEPSKKLGLQPYFSTRLESWLSPRGYQ
jgi:hypothetical protein